jgi:hypothetical protein
VQCSHGISICIHGSVLTCLRFECKGSAVTVCHGAGAIVRVTSHISDGILRRCSVGSCHCRHSLLEQVFGPILAGTARQVRTQTGYGSPKCSESADSSTSQSAARLDWYTSVLDCNLGTRLVTPSGRVQTGLKRGGCSPGLVDRPQGRPPQPRLHQLNGHWAGQAALLSELQPSGA